MVDNVAGLADAIKALRAELAEAQRAGGDQEIHFRVSNVELTINAVVVRGANGRVGWSVLGLGAKAESAVTQILKLSLQPVQVTEAGEIEFRVADSDRRPPDLGQASDE